MSDSSPTTSAASARAAGANLAPGETHQGPLCASRGPDTRMVAPGAQRPLEAQHGRHAGSHRAGRAIALACASLTASVGRCDRSG